MAEQDFFEEEARMARAALRNVLKDAGRRIKSDGDLTPLIRHRPWASLATALSGGLLSGYLLTPSRRSPEQRLQRRAERAKKKTQKKGQAGGFQGQLLRAVGPAIRNFAATAAGALFHSYQQQAGEQAEEHGAHAQPEKFPGRRGAEAEDFSRIPQHRLQL